MPDHRPTKAEVLAFLARTRGRSPVQDEVLRVLAGCDASVYLTARDVHAVMRLAASRQGVANALRHLERKGLSLVVGYEPRKGQPGRRAALWAMHPDAGKVLGV